MSFVGRARGKSEDLMKSSSLNLTSHQQLWLLLASKDVLTTPSPCTLKEAAQILYNLALLLPSIIGKEKDEIVMEHERLRNLRLSEVINYFNSEGSFKGEEKDGEDNIVSEEQQSEKKDDARQKTEQTDLVQQKTEQTDLIQQKTEQTDLVQQKTEQTDLVQQDEQQHKIQLQNEQSEEDEYTEIDSEAEESGPLDEETDHYPIFYEKERNRKKVQEESAPSSENDQLSTSTTTRKSARLRGLKADVIPITPRLMGQKGRSQTPRTGNKRARQ